MQEHPMATGLPDRILRQTTVLDRLAFVARRLTGRSTAGHSLAKSRSAPGAWTGARPRSSNGFATQCSIGSKIILRTRSAGYRPNRICAAHGGGLSVRIWHHLVGHVIPCLFTAALVRPPATRTRRIPQRTPRYEICQRCRKQHRRDHNGRNG